jgi:hypothetical protein
MYFKNAYFKPAISELNLAYRYALVDLCGICFIFIYFVCFLRQGLTM